MNRPSLHFCLAALVVLLLPLCLSSGTLATEILIFAMAAAACNLLLGYTGLLSLGQGIFFGLGSYAIGLLLLRTSLPLSAALVMAVVIGAVTATGIGWLSIRRQGVYFVMLTLAFTQFFFFLAYTQSDLTGGDNGLLDIPRPAIGPISLESSWSYYAFVAVIFLVVFAALLRATTSTFGRTLQAIRDNEARAQAIGFSVRWFKILAFTISGGVTALAGAFHAMLVGVAPLTNIDYHASESILVMTVLGGTKNLFGSVLGAAFYVLAADNLSALWPRWLLLLGILLIAMVLFMRDGLWGVLEAGATRLGRLFSRSAKTPGKGTEAAS